MQELRASQPRRCCRELQPLPSQPGTHTHTHTHSQVHTHTYTQPGTHTHTHTPSYKVCPGLQDAEALRREVSCWENQARQREHRLAELERELLEKTSRVESLRLQLDESTRQLDDGRRQLEETRRRQGEAEQKLTLRLQECEDELARQAATPPRVKVRNYTTGESEAQCDIKPAP